MSGARDHRRRWPIGGAPTHSRARSLRRARSGHRAGRGWAILCPVPLPTPTPPPIVELAGVEVRRAGRTILGPLDWTIRAGERWAVIGPNGSGKTTLLQVLSTYLWPTRGRVSVLGEELGSVDARELRRRVGYASSAL
ncbi:MAG: ATP-binding cassette domain-containing protein, partial [Chloroflexi bacterium]|nr:ATP-binding cassette domain-containing protein [Chloroflexota bacterium]